MEQTQDELAFLMDKFEQEIKQTNAVPLPTHTHTTPTPVLQRAAPVLLATETITENRAAKTTTLQELDYITAKQVAAELQSKTSTLLPKYASGDTSTTLTAARTAFFARPVKEENISEEERKKAEPMYRKKLSRKAVRTGAGQVWEDPSMELWPESDFRLFCGDLGNEVTDDLLRRTFSVYPSFARAHVVRDKKTGKTKGYGFISFVNQEDYTRAFREWNGKYVGNRPIKLKKSSWKDRALK